MVDIPPSRRPEAIEKAALLILGAKIANPTHNAAMDGARQAAEAAFMGLPEDVQSVLDNVNVATPRRHTTECACAVCERHRAWR